jgi:TRAP-type C4-dicarboxylate transport system permease small subunit
MRRLLDGVYMGTAWLAAASVFAICALMLLQSIGRLMGVPTGGANDVVAWLCAASAFLAMAHAFRHGDFVRVTLVYEKVSPAAQRAMETCALAIAAAAVGYLSWWATRFTYESWQFNEISSGLIAVPLWIPQTAFVVGTWVFLIAVLDEAWTVLRGGRPSYVVAVEQRHARGDFSSDI